MLAAALAVTRGVRLAVPAFGGRVPLAQVVRGAHFVSHVLLTEVVCRAVAWAFDRGYPVRRG